MEKFHENLFSGYLAVATNVWMDGQTNGRTDGQNNMPPLSAKNKYRAPSVDVQRTRMVTPSR